VQWPVEELNSLRGKEVKLSNHKLKKGEYLKVSGITAAQVKNFTMEILGVIW